jgi:catechol 2,3-dioxygenase
MRAYLPDQSRVSQVHLRTANLERALAFYTGVLGLTAQARPGSGAALPSPPLEERARERRPNVLSPNQLQSQHGAALSAAADEPELIILTEDRNAPPRPPQTTGLFHFALRYPQRQALAQAVQRVVDSGYEIDGASDHGVSEAIYLADPDGNGVELYADRPAADWPRRHGQIAMTSGPLNLGALLASAPSQSAADDPLLRPDREQFGVHALACPSLGHIHLEVADLAAAERFYSEFLGFSVTQRSYPGALFFAAGNYHHHIAVNTWAGRTVAPVGSVGLISYRLEVPVAELLYCLNQRAPFLAYETKTESTPEGAPILQIRDPNGNSVEIQASPAALASEWGSRCFIESAATRIMAAFKGSHRKHPARK